MNFQFFLFCIKFITFSFQYYLVIANPMFGQNTKTAREGDFPYVVSLSRTEVQHINPGIDHICTGVLISRQDVLTLSSCLRNRNWESTAVLVGSYNLSLCTMYYILWWMNFNQWSAVYQFPLDFEENDISNIRLRSQVPENIPIAIISDELPTEFYAKQVDTASWGKSASNIIRKFMRKAKLLVMPIDECRNDIIAMTGVALEIQDRYLCTKGPRAPILMHKGDEGAPLVYEGAIIAIHKERAPFPEESYNRLNLNINIALYNYRYFIHNIVNPDFNGPLH